jgi:hypothetical protein
MLAPVWTEATRQQPHRFEAVVWSVLTFQFRRGVLQCVQRGEHGPAGEHDQRLGIWSDQQNGWDLSADSG